MTGKHENNRLSPEDRDLWRQVTRSVTPLERRARAAAKKRAEEAREAAQQEPSEPAPAAPAEKAGAKVPRPAAAPRAPDPAAEPLPLTGLDRRTRQRLSRGQLRVDARIDLHGLSREAARADLLAFLGRARARGLRWVLVITGKGRAPYARHTLHTSEYVPSPDRSGILREALPQWLAEPAFRAHVSGFQPAHPRHGGGGAFYLRLRRSGRSAPATE